MAFSVDATSHATAIANSGIATLTWSHTCGASANKLVVLAGGAEATLGTRTITGVTYNGTALTKIGAADDGSFERAEIWRLNNPPTGSALNIVVTYGSNARQQAAGAISFIDAAASEGTPSTATSTTANPSITVADSASGDIVVGCYASDLGPDGTSTENGTLIWEDEDLEADSDFAAQRVNATGANTVVSWTASAPSAGAWAIIGVAIKAATATTTQTQPPANIRHSEGGKRRNWDKTGWFNTRAAKNDWFWRGWPVTTTSGVTGTLAKTNANDTSAAAGTTTIVGTLAKTNNNDTSAASGTTTILGTLAKTNANDTSAASGTTTVTGTVAKTNNNDSVVASGSVGAAVSGTLATTNANDTLAASGTITILGTLARTNANDTSAASGTTTILGTLARTNANDSVVASGMTTVTGTVAKTNANDSVVASGTVGTVTVTGTVAYTNNDDGATASGVVTQSESIGRRRKTRRLLVVRFDDQEIGVESAAELKQLARLSDSLPVVTLLPNVDYGSKIAALQKAAEQINRERERILDQEDEEFLMLVA